MSKCKCRRDEVCKCSVREDDLNWAKALAVVGLGLFLVMYVLPRIYAHFTEPTATHITAQISKPIAVGERVRLSGITYVVVRPLDMNVALRAVDYDLSALRHQLVEDQYLVPLVK